MALELETLFILKSKNLPFMMRTQAQALFKCLGMQGWHICKRGGGTISMPMTTLTAAIPSFVPRPIPVF